MNIQLGELVTNWIDDNRGERSRAAFIRQQLEYLRKINRDLTQEELNEQQSN